MKFYIVGAAESLCTKGMFGSLNKRELTDADFLNNLIALESLKLFTTMGEATDYARSLRVQPCTKMQTLNNRKIAPVIEVDFTPESGKYQEHDLIKETVYFEEYANFQVNYSNARKAALISYFSENASNLNWTEIKFITAQFPDVNYELHYFNQVDNECVLF